MPDQEASLLIRFRDETLSGGGTSKGFSARKDDGGAGSTAGAQVAEDFQRSIGQGAGRQARGGNSARTWALGEHPGDWNLGDDPQPVPPDGARSIPSDGTLRLPSGGTGPLFGVIGQGGQAAARAYEDNALLARAGGTAADVAMDAQIVNGANLGEALQAASGLAAAGGGRTVAGLLGRAAAIPGIAAMEVPPALAAAIPAIAATAAPAALAVGGVAAGAGVAAVIANEANRARGQIGGLSGQLAAAEAEASVRETMTRLRTAGILGDETADYVRQRSRIGSATTGLRDVISEPAIREMNRYLAVIATALEGANNVAQTPAGRFLIDTFITKLKEQVMMPFGGPALDLLMRIAERLGLLNDTASSADNPFTYFINHPLAPLPPPFTGEEEKPINAAFAPVAGLTF